MRVALIHQHDCHSVIRKFAQSLDSDFYLIKKLPFHSVSGIVYAFYLALRMPSYPVYFTDSAMSNFVPIFKRWFGEKNIIIFRGGDGIFGEKSNAYLYTKNPLKKKVLLYLLRHVDGVITESEMAKRDAERWVSCPVHVAMSYVSKGDLLTMLPFNASGKNFLFIGEYRPPYDHKGVTLLIQAFNLLKDTDLHLYVIGKHTSALSSIVKNPNIHLLDYVPDLTEYFKRCTFYIHPARYETGPITVLEAMLAGLVPLVSSTSGHHTFALDLESELVLSNLQPKAIAERIRSVSRWKSAKLKKLSAKSRVIKNEVSQEKRIHVFREEFFKLVSLAKQRRHL